MPMLPTLLLKNSRVPKRIRTPEAGYSDPATVDILDCNGEVLAACLGALEPRDCMEDAATEAKAIGRGGVNEPSLDLGDEAAALCVSPSSSGGDGVSALGAAR
mmetsp:Transcript_107618/g.169895  ORF Transcript_107618/g.169895 Transcript_107618/m.169895 type:complete len:103 (-) Transcript_107618:1199-1507(-)|eukprot:CAMPEP_0169375376 /NCGR_PEP_ID=MMETSP1017-20121227/38074_1 /TAXON_ID=342587 /ORGANISM="Karlodinium micrum, Strain CCMP2283" /LENGTH=102 /DNA_ID=CAMNT_0009474289 /DNA_START=264 /DNA_END=572 /DNA_ORIENTATION=-